MSQVSHPGLRAARRPRAEWAVAPVLQKMLGSLPVTAEFCRRLGIAEIIDELCPMRDVASSRVTHGQTVEALIANRLTSPRSMVRVSEWAREWAVEEVFGIPAAALGDDRIARALDAIAPELEHIVGSVGARAIDVFGIDVSRMHWDMTSISLYGSYGEVDEAFPAPAFGHPKDGRTDLKQAQVGICSSDDGGIPLWSQGFDGNAGEVNQVIGAFTQMQKMARRKDLLLVGDSKLISYGNVAAMTVEGVRFVAPLGAARTPDGVFAGLSCADATQVDYVAERYKRIPADKRDTYHVLEGGVVELRKGGKSNPDLRCRRIFVYSSANARAQATNRARKLGRAQPDLEKLARNAGTHHYPDSDAVTAKLTALASKYRVTAYLRSTITTDPDGKPHLQWDFDQTAIAAEAANDGWYALITNIPADQASPAEIFLHYKGQPIAERRYGNLKGPLAVAPLYLQHNRRITALVGVICLALLIFCLIERQARINLAPETEIIGFYAYDNRAMKPTTQLILNALAYMRLIPAQGNHPPQIVATNYLQPQLLTLLHVDPTRPRWKTE
jgi:transposase